MTENILASFDIKKVIGRGTFGSVLQASVKYARRVQESHDGGRSEDVALKRISLSCGRSIQKELTALLTVKGNVNVVDLLACFSSKEKTTGIPSVYLVLPFFANAAPFIEYASNISVTALTAYMYQLLSGLEYIHWRHIIHRDIKPSNVLWDPSTSRLLIVDFGLAREAGTAAHPEYVLTALEAHPTLRAGAYLKHYPGRARVDGGGTFGMRAPEVLFGCAVHSPAIDIWSAGQIFLLLLVGCAEWFVFNEKRFGPNVDGNAINLAQMCSMFGSKKMGELASALGFELTCYWPHQEATHLFIFPKGGLPIVEVHDLRQDGNRFEPSQWDLLASCYNLSPVKRITASAALALPIFKTPAATGSCAPVRGVTVRGPKLPLMRRARADQLVFMNFNVNFQDPLYSNGHISVKLKQPPPERNIGYTKAAPPTVVAQIVASHTFTKITGGRSWMFLVSDLFTTQPATDGSLFLGTVLPF